MKKVLTIVALTFGILNANAQYQIGNSDFESWGSDANEPGSGWYSFSSATGSFSSFSSSSKSTCTKVTGTDACGGSGTSVLLESKKVVIANANGNLTTGIINMGSTTPSNSANYNYTDRNGSNHWSMTGHPDSLVYWGKFTRGGSGTYTGRCHAILHGDIDYKDPYETSANEASYKIAEAAVYCTETDTWTRYSGPFNYTGVTSGTMYLLASFTTNETPGGSKGDKFYIDNVQLIYNSELASATYDGTAVSFTNDTATVDALYDESKLALTSNGHGASIEKSYDASTAALTITVKGEDISVNASNYHTYTIQFKMPPVPLLVDILIGKTTDYILEVADVNGDKKVSLADLTKLINLVKE